MIRIVKRIYALLVHVKRRVFALWLRILGRFNYYWYSYPNDIIFVAGLPKSGTTWVENFLTMVGGYSIRPISGDPNIIINNDLPVNAFELFPEGEYSFIKTHANPSVQNIEVIKSAGITKILIMYRDIRDVTVSRYFHLLKFPKGPDEPYAVDYNRISKEEGMKHSATIVIDRMVPWIDGWIEEARLNPEKYLVIKYEQLLEDPAREFGRINTFFDLGMSENKIERILRKLQEMKKRVLDIDRGHGQKSTFRKGIIGDWKNHFNPEVKKLFKERVGDFLIKLGYEKDRDW